MSDLYSSLQWLPRPPYNFSSRLAEAATRPDGELTQELMALAAFALDESQLNRLSKSLNRLVAAGRPLPGLQRFRLGLVGTSTLDLLIPPLIATALRHGILLDVITANYGQVAQEALDAASAINTARCDAVLLALDYRSLPIPEMLAARGDAVAAAVDLVNTLRNGFHANGGALSIIQTFAAPPEQLFGNFDRRVAETTHSLLAQINADLIDSIAGTADLMLDIASLANTVGTANWFAPESWNLAKLAFAPQYIPLYADHVGRLLGAVRGHSRRCLILDLDNTLWGGVIGDRGPEGITLGQGDPVGEAHLEVQRTALMLRERGVVLAVSSKNTDAIAREPFKSHPEMVLREQHIAVFQANWDDKASNIKAIADSLSLGLRSMVFLDDNPVERNLVRTLLPDVTVPEMPEDPALFARTLLAAGYFEAIAYSDEDRARADFYQDNARRLELKSKVAGVQGYLESLQMEIEFAPFDSVSRSRITQLINKSNQFNLTTRRYTEAEVQALETEQGVYTLQVRLADVFGDNGMISVLIARAVDEEEWAIDTWLMSCRVLGRRVEHMVLRELLEAARGQGVQRVTGLYLPTAKNALVKDHYETLGFTKIAAAPDGSSRWMLDTGAHVEPAPMKIRRRTASSARE